MPYTLLLDFSTCETVTRHLENRLMRSKNIILFIGDTTKEDAGWVPFEIRYAIDECRIPIVCQGPDLARWLPATGTPRSVV